MLCEMAPYILLGFLIAGVLNSFVPQSLLSRHLSGRGWKPAFKAAMVGVPLPLCSCGVLPTAISLHRAGASKGATTSFLIATPQTGMDSIAATWSLLGAPFAIIRPIAALCTAMFGGVAAGKLDKPRQAAQCAVVEEVAEKKSFWQKCVEALRYGFVDLVSSIGGWLVIGLIIAAVITVYVPQSWFEIFADRPLLSMLIVLVIAIPMYVCATGSIPIAMSLMLKGLSPGTALVLLMAGPAANFASFTLIAREMGKKAAIIYVAAIVVGAMLFGLAIDFLLPESWFDISAIHEHAAHGGTPGIFPSVCAGILVILLVIGLLRGHHHHHINHTEMTQAYIVTGMNCPHCQAAVTKAISGVEGVTAVDVNLSTGVATVEGTPQADAVRQAVRAAGFDVKE